MPIDLAIPHAVLLLEPSGVRLVAKSDDFTAELETLAAAVVERYGPKPDGVAVPAALLVVPLGQRFVGVMQIADQNSGLGFRVLALNRKLYEAVSDPFAVADRFPPPWAAFGSLPPLAWPPDPNPPRTVAEVAELLRTDGPLHLGGAQAMLDGVKIALARPAPDDALIRKLWKLLPYRERCDLSFATFAFALDESLNLTTLPALPSPLPPGWVSEERCGDHPPGKYELALQLASEAGNQREVDRLFTRRGSRETLKLALILVGLAAVALVASKLFFK